jgi:hypothetical protein
MARLPSRYSSGSASAISSGVAAAIHRSARTTALVTACSVCGFFAAKAAVV